MKDPDTKTPFELSCHSALLNVNGADNIARLKQDIHRGLINNDSCAYKLYLAWSPHRDLHTLISYYRDQVNMNPAAHIPEVSCTEYCEPFIFITIALARNLTYNFRNSRWSGT